MKKETMTGPEKVTTILCRILPSAEGASVTDMRPGAFPTGMEI